MMGYITKNIENGVAVISINRPKALNALSREIVDEMWDVFEEMLPNTEFAVSNPDSVRCVVIYSEKNFAAGADIKEMIECNVEEAGAFCFNPVYDKIATYPVPIIAAIEGYALGGGFELALCCDIRFADEKARMGFPEVTLGIFPGAGGTVRAAKIAGPAVAKELIFSGENIAAPRAFEVGLVNRIVPEGTVLEESLAFAKKIAKRGPVAVRMAKDCIDYSFARSDTLEGVRYETEQWPKLFATQDQKEGMRAFTDGRKPSYQNK